MEGKVLLQGMAQLWKGVYCCKQWHSYGRECTVASSGTVMEGSVLLQGMAHLNIPQHEWIQKLFVVINATIVWKKLSLAHLPLTLVSGSDTMPH